MKQKIALSPYKGKKYEFKGPTPLASKWFCRHDWRGTEVQLPKLSGDLRRQQCEHCGMVDMR